MFESHEWKRVIERLDELESGLSATSSQLQQLVQRQQLQHEENRAELERSHKDIERIGTMLVGVKGDNGLVGTVTAMKGQVANIEASVTKIETTFSSLPKTILTILLIFTALVGLLTFLGPSMRRAVGLPAAHALPHIGAFITHKQKFDTSIPSIVSYGDRP